MPLIDPSKILVDSMKAPLVLVAVHCFALDAASLLYIGY